MTKLIQIGIAEDHLLTRQGLISLLKEFEGINVMFDVANGRELLDTLKKSVPDIILLDIEMPVMNGREVFEKIKVKYPKLKIIIISMHFKDSYIIEFVKKGASSFLNKNSSIEKIVDALFSVHEHGFYYDNTVAMIMAKSIASNCIPPSEDILELTDITSREIEIIRLICLNKSNKEIAESLSISVRTVEGHRLHIMKKTNCKNALELTTFAIQNNFVSVS